MNRFVSLFFISLAATGLASCASPQAKTHAVPTRHAVGQVPRVAAIDARADSVGKEVAYPEALWGTWRLDPLRRPCVLPLSPDSDGRFVVRPHAIESYESMYTPVSVEADPDRKNSWHIVSIESHLGTQKEAVRHSFALEGDRLVEQDGDYRAIYMKCKERGR